MIKERQYISFFLAVFIYASSVGMAGQQGADIKAPDDGSPSYREGGYQNLSGILEKDVNSKTFNNTGLTHFPVQNLKSYDGIFNLQSIYKVMACCWNQKSFQHIHFLLSVHFFPFHSFW